MDSPDPKPGYWTCVCRCGRFRSVLEKSLRSGSVTGCRYCAYPEKPDPEELEGPLYQVWSRMVAFEDDLDILSEWVEDYYFFREWADANGYEDNDRLRRIDPKGPFDTENCFWTRDPAIPDHDLP